MSYLQKNKQRPGSIKSISLRLLIVVVILIAGAFLVKVAAVTAYEWLRPVRYVVDQSFSYGKSLFYSKYALEQKIVGLETERDELRAKVNELRVYEHFAIDVVGATSSPMFAARVIARPPYTGYDTLLLNKGEKSGVAVGQKVLTTTSRLPIGIVTKTEAENSYVTLYSNPDQKNEIELGTSTAVFEAMGTGNGVFEARVPRAVIVKAGEIVKMPQLSLFPYSSVENVISSDSDPFSTVRFRLPVRFDQLEFVNIEK